MATKRKKQQSIPYIKVTRALFLTGLFTIVASALLWIIFMNVIAVMLCALVGLLIMLVSLGITLVSALKYTHSKPTTRGLVVAFTMRDILFYLLFW